jgi:hypothetical protein
VFYLQIREGIKKSSDKQELRQEALLGLQKQEQNIKRLLRCHFFPRRRSERVAFGRARSLAQYNTPVHLVYLDL